jgi:hypothetical protein
MGRLAAVALFAGLVFVGMSVAGPAVADPFLSDRELEFVGSVAPQGYSGDVYATVNAGYRVCSLLDDRVSHEGIARFVQDTFGDSRANWRYYATLFGAIRHVQLVS